MSLLQPNLGMDGGHRPVRSPLLRLIVGMQLVTIALYYLGPVNYFGRSADVGIWVLYYIFMLAIGATLARHVYFTSTSNTRERQKRFLKYSVIVGLIFIFPTFFARVGDLSFTESLGDQYVRSLEYRESNQSAFEYVRMFFSVYLFGFFPVFIYYYGELRTKWKVLGLSVIVLNIFLAVFTGVNKYIFDYILITTAITLLKGFAVARPSYKLIAAYTIVLVACTSAALYFFAVGQSTRAGSPAISGVDNRLNATYEYNVHDGLFLMGYSALTSYLTQGYRVFDLSIEEKFVWTYGVGNSTFLSRRVDKLFGSKISEASYPARVEYRGVDRFINWSTFYLWWASDLTYIGVGPLLLLAGFLFRALENTILRFRDVGALVLYAYMAIGLFYLSANNQLFQSGESAIGFVYLLVVFLKSRKMRLAFVKRFSRDYGSDQGLPPVTG
jgi:hypothetical protein